MPRTPLVILLVHLLFAAGPAFAQANPANVVTPAPPPRAGTVGPEQLRDFSLPGTRQTAPASEPAPAAAATVSPPETRPPVQTSTLPRPRPAEPGQGMEDRSPRATPPASDAGIVTQPDGATDPSIESSQTTPVPVPELPESPAPVVFPPAEAEPASPALLWPWALAAIFVLGGLGLLARRRLRQPALVNGRGLAPAAEPPLPSPSPPSPREAPKPKPAAPPPSGPRGASDLPSGVITTRLRSGVEEPLGGVVSTRLRPWVDLDLAVEGLEITDEEVRFRIRLALGNGGAVPAREIAVEAVALNAGTEQASDLGEFFQRPAARENSLERLEPMAVHDLQHLIRMPRGAIREYDAGGRPLFVPILAFTATYRWAHGGGRTSAAFLVGHDKPGSDRLAPLSLASGASRLGRLGCRRLPEAVRN